MPAIILDSNQPALLSCRAGVGRAGVCRANAFPEAFRQWDIIRTLSADQNNPPATDIWSDATPLVTDTWVDSTPAATDTWIVSKVNP